MKTLMLASLAVLVASPVLASIPSFERLDANNDNRVSQGEFYAYPFPEQRYYGHFFRLDRDNDRALTQAEYSRFRNVRDRFRGSSGD